MLVLASGSEARQRLLKQVGIAYKARKSGVNENLFQHDDPKQLTSLLAEAKALAVFNKLRTKPSDFLEKNNFKAILGCDSVFEFNGSIYGKPNSSDETICRWKMMSSKTGLLHTGHYLLYLQDKEGNYIQQNQAFTDISSEVISSKIFFEEINEDEIKRYSLTGEPLMCAGGFSIDGKGAIFINKIDGCASNVIGMSLPWLRRKYINHFKIN